MTHEQWEELAAGHALDALEPADEAAFLAHLRGCSLCERSLDELRALAAQVAYAAEPAEPPARLKARILAATDAAETSSPLVLPAARPPRRTFGRGHAIRALAAAAAVVLVLSLAALNTGLRADNEVRAASQKKMAAALALANDPETTRVSMTTEDGGHITALVGRSAGFLLVDDLPGTTRSNFEYVLWTIRGSTPRALDDFEVTHDDVNVVPIGALDLGGVDALAVSREPRSTELPEKPTTVLAQGILPS